MNQKLSFLWMSLASCGDLRCLVLLTIVLFAALGNASDDWCEDALKDMTNFHTIGSVGGSLWAIQSDSNWTVYELKPMPCSPGNGSTSNKAQCLEVQFPTTVGDKWPQLKESVQKAASVSDLNIKIKKSVILKSDDLNEVLVLNSDPFKPVNLFGYRFDQSEFVLTTQEVGIIGLWLSSDQSKAYRLFNRTKLQEIEIFKYPSKKIVIRDVDNSPAKSICNVRDDSVQFVKDCNSPVDWHLVRGVRHSGQFYLFASDQVYTFSADGIELDSGSPFSALDYDKFFLCKSKPTPPPIPTHANKATTQVTQPSEHESTAVSGSKFAIIIAVVLVLIVVVLIVIGVYFFFFRNKNGDSEDESKVPPKGAKFSGKEPKLQMPALSAEAVAAGLTRSSFQALLDEEDSKPKLRPLKLLKHRKDVNGAKTSSASKQVKAGGRANSKTVSATVNPPGGGPMIQKNLKISKATNPSSSRT